MSAKGGKRRVTQVSNSELGSTKRRLPPRMLCCICGVSMETNPSSMCIQCLRSNVDITQGIPTQLILHQCRGCARYLGHSTSTAAWVDCDLESKELLSICLRKITGLKKKVRLIDAVFEWTEPHSKRVKVILTVQKEVFGMVLQQKFKVTYVVQNQPCDRCVKEAAEGQWAAIVQVRQKVVHKRTIFFMEQKILKHNMHVKCHGITPVPGAGLDFYFAERSHARSFMAFLDKIVPISIGSSRQLTTHDGKSNIYSFKYNFLVDIVPICVDDLVMLPSSTAQKLGNISQLAVCFKVSNVLHFIDPATLKIGELQTNKYWAEPFRALCAKERLIPFTVLDVQPVRTATARDAARSCRGKFLLAEVTVSRPRDMGDPTRSHTIVTHLGNVLRPGDTCLGYDTRNAVLNDDDLAGRSMKSGSSSRDFRGTLPPVVLVRKVYKRSMKKRTNRQWTLKRMLLQEPAGAGNSHANANDEKDFEDFMQDLEENPDMRGEINLYKDPQYKPPQKSSEATDEMSLSDSDDDDFPEIQLSELLDSVHLTAKQPSTTSGQGGGEGDAPKNATDTAVLQAAAATVGQIPDEDDPDL